MSRERRTLTAVALAAVLVGVGVGCGSEDVAAPVDTGTDTTSPAAAPTTAAPTTVAPTTVAPTTVAPTTVAPTTAPASDDPADAAATAWVLVFDSEEPFDAKSPHLADADALRPTVEAYQGAGSGFGGINLEPTDVTVEGDTATITYDVNFGENPAYGDQVGTITLVDGVWTVAREEFCSFMASARVPCP